MKKNEHGITLVEVIVVVFIVSMFMVILISDFPRMMRQMALSRASYNFAQDLRKAQDLGLSGILLNDIDGNSIKVKGYGIYTQNNSSQYLIYADVADSNDINNQKYDGTFNTPFCNSVTNPTPRTNDCVIQLVDISEENPTLFIETDNSISGVSINFSPPNPTITITDGGSVSYPYTTIYLKNSDEVSRGVFVNSSGLIDIQ